MKKLFFLPIMLVLLLASCDTDQATEETLNREEIHQKAVEYASQFENWGIEYTSLEGLNEAYKEAGLSEISLEDLGVTQEEYDIAQERINSNVEIRVCNAWDDAVWMGDMSQDGILSNSDIILARRQLLGIDDFTYFGIHHFALLSIYYFNSSPSLTTLDVIACQRVILGLAPCNL